MREISADLAEAASGAATPAVHARRMRLGSVRRGVRGIVVGVEARPARAGDALAAAELERRLLEMGFVEGAHFEVLHEGPIGRDPIAVKLDDSRVALRRRDADALIVETEQEMRAA